jgi:putative membrane protein
MMETKKAENENVTALTLRSIMGGMLMGLANLVPGISGGTMLLAAGVYPKFINGIAEVTRLQFKKNSIVVLSGVIVSAALSILLFAGFIKDLVVDHRWIMYSLFVGLTLGGIPVVKKLAGKNTNKIFWCFAVLGFIAMTVLALAQTQGWGQSSSAGNGVLLMFVAGLAGASAMILPGLSGGYLLLVLGAYIPILSGIESIKDALKLTDFNALMDPMLTVVLPVGFGVVIGVASVSNVLKWALDKHIQPTLGLLLGLLVGAVVGLWPFQRAVEPVVGMIVKGTKLTKETLLAVDTEDLPTEFFTPDTLQVCLSLAIILVGVGVTFGVSLLGASKTNENVQ